MTNPVLVEVVRSGFVECVHRGSVVAVAAGGDVLLAVGDPAAPVLSRSSLKPLQVEACRRAGLDLPPRLLAVAAASHDGLPEHVDAVRELLATVGLDASALRNTPDRSLNPEAARSQPERSRLHQNCSGKHAAMLATCVVNGWPLDTYLDVDHPLQRQVRATVEELTGEAVPHVAVDGCGAPMFATSLTGLAVAFGRLAGGVVAEAMRAEPRLVGGPARDVTRLMEAVPGLFAKDGAEGVYACATADGTGIALKVDDGAGRARMPALVAALRHVGVDDPGLAALATAPVLGHGVPVGEVRAAGFRLP